MANQVPGILYKYRAFNERAIDILKKNEVYFAHPDDFNDPFDCAAQENMFENFKHNVLQNFKLVPDSFLTQNHFRDYLDELKNNFGIFSLCEPNDSILMWSHYADSHKGFRIGFRSSLFVSDNLIKKVVYTKNINTSFLFDFQDPNRTEEVFGEELMREFFLTKFLDWSYEREWRILVAPSRIPGSFPPNCIDRIIFGLKMPEEHRTAIREILKDKNINYFEASKSKKDFAIEIIQVSE